MRCWICYEEDNLYKCCNCNNEYGVAHKKCILKLNLSNKKKCIFCKNNYKMNIFYKILYKIIYIYDYIKKQIMIGININNILLNKCVQDKVINNILMILLYKI